MWIFGSLHTNTLFFSKPAVYFSLQNEVILTIVTYFLMATLPPMPSYSNGLLWQLIRPLLVIFNTYSSLQTKVFWRKLRFKLQMGKKQHKSPLNTKKGTQNVVRAQPTQTFQYLTSMSESSISLSDHWGKMSPFFNHAAFLSTGKEKEYLQLLLFTTTWQNAPTKDGVNFSAGDFNCWATLEVVLQTIQS